VVPVLHAHTYPLPPPLPIHTHTHTCCTLYPHFPAWRYLVRYLCLHLYHPATLPPPPTPPYSPTLPHAAQVGMSKFDGLAVLRLFVARLGEFRYVPERLTQSLTNWAVALRLARGGPIAALPQLANGGGAPLVTLSTPVAYYGVSQGAILGGAYVAFSPDITRGVLGVSGTNFALIMTRSAVFTGVWLSPW
jgi:hypothetical protein